MKKEKINSAILKDFDNEDMIDWICTKIYVGKILEAYFGYQLLLELNETEEEQINETKHTNS